MSHILKSMISKKTCFFKFSFFAVSILAFSCSHNVGKTPDIILDRNIDITVDVKKTDSIPLSNIVSEVKFVQFDSSGETSFEKIDELDYDDSRYFVLDKDYAKKLIIFDANGKLIKQTASGQKNSPITFCLDKANNHIIVAYKNQKINTYDYDLNLVGQDSLYLFYRSLAFSPIDSTLLFNFSKMINFKTKELAIGERKEISYELYVYNKNDNIKNLYFPFSLDQFPQGSLYPEIPRSFYNYKDTILYVKPLDNSIYAWNGGKHQFERRYSIRFQNSKILENIDSISGKAFFDFLHSNLSDGYSFLIKDAIETDKILFFNFFKEKELFTNVYLKNTGHSISGKLINDIYHLPILISDKIQDQFISVVYPRQIEEFYKNRSKESLGDVFDKLLVLKNKKKPILCLQKSKF
ncbi:6-bladed beta-propeller [Sphingobacterium siyangense]|uniref:6-bladed beta-propeller n=1 Tax=Sphingobacterium siyangense TaxID=459529 RepID=UPI0019630746|nr:6-bladed beta-propeller [Sphingobacterium siyangense]QRY58804.1 6-bladed beta-propeller [Sphingobacterium siyangense]